MAASSDRITALARVRRKGRSATMSRAIFVGSKNRHLRGYWIPIDMPKTESQLEDVETTVGERVDGTPVLRPRPQGKLLEDEQAPKTPTDKSELRTHLNPKS
ncbi:MAG: hypothetical protein AAFQ66_21270 [Pseudomonadota bacterium]